ncbi:MAG: M6 family metalloprotease domain-containing protein [Lentimicrobiaceae bacterium]|nr:M6 family metalloprotease domain-containing protein [Lentimicrobiaceae bacterium]
MQNIRNFCKTSLRQIFVGVFFWAFVFTAQAAYIENFPVAITQPDSSVVHCFVSGDEFYNWVHDSNGYTLIRDSITGFVVYADLDLQNDELVSTGYVVGSVNPATIGLQPGIMISAGKREQLRKNFLNHIPPKPSNSRGSSPPLLNVGQNNGNINNIVIYIRFAGESEFPAKANTYNSWFNDTAVNTPSMYRYFRDVSYGKTSISTTFYPPHSGNIITSYQDIYPRSYYQPYNASTNPNGYTGDDSGNPGTPRTIREHQLLQRAVDSARNHISPSLNLDFNNDGCVDNICFIVSGSAGAWSSLLWPHRWALYSYNVILNGKTVWDFNFQIETHLDGSGASVLSHEMFHTLGAPDLYRYNNKTINPVGSWDLMASNTSPPQSTSAYMKYKYGGWIDSIPEITQSGTYTLHDVWSDTNNAYKIASPSSANEYFVVEYRRTNLYWDSQIPGSGLLIYRINPSVQEGNAEGPPDEVYVFRPGGTNTTTDGVIANAHFSSQVGRTTFNDGTNPPCFLSNNSAGGIHIANIDSSGGTTISFDVIMNHAITATAGRGGTILPSGKVIVGQGGSQTFTFSANPNYIIQSVLVDGVNVPDSIAGGSYTFNNITENHTIDVLFDCIAHNLPIAENFNNAIFPPDCWDISSATNKHWDRVISGTYPSCYPKSVGGMMRYYCYTYSAGSTGLLISPEIKATRNCKLTFWIYRGSDWANNADRVNIYLSPTQSVSGLKPVDSVHRSTILYPWVGYSGWYEHTVNLPTDTMSSAYVILEGVSAYGYNIFVDDIKIEEISPIIAKWNNYTPNAKDTISLATGGSPANNGIATLTRDTAGRGYAVYTDGVAASTGWDSAATNAKYWITKFSTVGFANLKLTSKQRGSDTGPKDFKIQYKVGASGSWTDVANGTILVANDNYISGKIDSLPLPSAMNNEPEVFLRWLCTSTVSINNGTVGSSGVNRLDATIFGEEMERYIITASAGNNIKLSSVGNTTVYQGESLTFSFAPDTCYEIDSLWINGVYSPDSIAAGSYTFYNVSGNQSIAISLKRLPPDTVTFYDTICYGENYNLNGFSILHAEANSLYFNNDLNINGCDSVTRLELSVYPDVPITNYAVTICAGNSYSDSNFKNLTQAGIYYDALQNVNGCDSVICLTIDHYPNTPITSYAATICAGNSYSDSNFTDLTQADIYYDTLHTIYGCDSVIELILTINPTYTDYETAVICQGETYDFRGQTYTVSGTYSDTLQTVLGCDSILELTLTVNPTYTDYETAVICQGETYDFRGQTYTVSGTYSDTLQTILGCDSILELTLTVNPLPDKPTITKNEDTLTASLSDSYQWYFNDASILGATEQHYIYTQNGIYFVEVAVEQECTAQSDTISITDVGISNYELEIRNCVIYPNPTDGKLSVVSSQLSEMGGEIEVYNVVGQVVGTYRIRPENTEITIDISHLASGLYFLKIQTNEGIITKKVIKN